MKNHSYYPRKLLLKCLLASRAVALRLSTSSYIDGCCGLEQNCASSTKRSMGTSIGTEHTTSARSKGTTALFSKLKYKSVDDNEFFEDLDLISKTATDTVTTTTPRKGTKIVVTNVHELREAILQNGAQLSDIDLQIDYSISPNHHGTTTLDNDNTPQQHEVLRLMHKRFLSDSKPNRRHPNDRANRLALAIEGGGMRGAVSAGMTAALASLGLADTVDIVYGSSAGCVIAAYLLSGQMCMDIYTDLLPDAKSQFVCKKRLVSGLFFTAMQQLKNKTIGAMQRQQQQNLSGEVKQVSTLEYHASHVTTKTINGGISTTATSFTMSYLNNTTSCGDHPPPGPTRTPGMNISFILDEIMCPRKGMRPFDLKTFHQNHKMQPLRVVSSVVKKSDGQMETIAFGSQEEDFHPLYDLHHDDVLFKAFSHKSSNMDFNNGINARKSNRSGLFACLEASMTVPGAAGPPKNMKRRKEKSINQNIALNKGVNGDDQIDVEETFACFDAFVFEPMPYRSAVEEGATHVLVFRSRPEGCKMDTKPGFYEKIVAPLYFRSHGLPDVGKYFQKGGQQYRYIEDVLTLQEGHKAGLIMRQAGNSDGKIPVPPTKLLYGIDDMDFTTDDIDVKQWKQAHLFPIVTPRGAPELQTLDQGKKNVIEAVRNGYAAAFDVLAPLVGITLNSTINGKQVAELLFPDSNRRGQESNKLIDLLMSTTSNFDDSIGQEHSMKRMNKNIKYADPFFQRNHSDTTTSSSCETNTNKGRNVFRDNQGKGMFLSFLPHINFLSRKYASQFEKTEKEFHS